MDAAEEVGPGAVKVALVAEAEGAEEAGHRRDEGSAVVVSWWWGGIVLAPLSQNHFNFVA